VDRAVDALRARGVRSGLVDIGGKMYGLGSPDDDAPGWSAGLFHPVSGKLEHVFVLRDAAVGTSGNSERFRTIGATRIGHLFDARRGVPSNGHLSASVVSPTCLEADLLCTVAFLVGPDRFRNWTGALETRFIG
jgi:thiamine biosynthesis lipoprotein